MSARVTEVVSVAAEGSTIETKNSDYSGLLTATQIAQIQSRGRDVVNLLRLLPGVHYENDIEAMGDSFGSQIPNIGGHAQALESGHRRRPERQRALGHQPHELVDQPRRDRRRSRCLLEHLQGGVRPQRRRQHPGRQQERQRRLSAAARTAYGKRDALERHRRGRTTAPASPKPTLHIDTPGFNLGGPVQIRASTIRAPTRSCSSSIRSRRRRCSSRGRCASTACPPRCERQGDFSQTFDANGRLIFIKDPASSAGVQRDGWRRRLLSGQHHSGEPARPRTRSRC